MGSVTPYLFEQDVNVKTLLYDSTYGAYQLWGDHAGASAPGTYALGINCNTSTAITCPNIGGCATGDGSTCPYNTACNVFLDNTGVAGYSTDPAVYPNSTEKSTFVWYDVTRTSMSAENFIAGSTGGRYFPSGYFVARLYPFRWNSPTGGRYLFSTTADNLICSAFEPFGALGAEYVAKSQVALQ
jgi:hypothetical protein